MAKPAKAQQNRTYLAELRKQSSHTRIAQQAGHGIEYAQLTGGASELRASGRVLHVAGVPRERESDRPCALRSHSIWTRCVVLRTCHACVM